VTLFFQLFPEGNSTLFVAFLSSTNKVIARKIIGLIHGVNQKVNFFCCIILVSFFSLGTHARWASFNEAPYVTDFCNYDITIAQDGSMESM